MSLEIRIDLDWKPEALDTTRGKITIRGSRNVDLEVGSVPGDNPLGFMPETVLSEEAFDVVFLLLWELREKKTRTPEHMLVEAEASASATTHSFPTQNGVKKSIREDSFGRFLKRKFGSSVGTSGSEVVLTVGAVGQYKLSDIDITFNSEEGARSYRSYLRDELAKAMVDSVKEEYQRRVLRGREPVVIDVLAIEGAIAHNLATWVVTEFETKEYPAFADLTLNLHFTECDLPSYRYARERGARFRKRILTRIQEQDRKVLKCMEDRAVSIVVHSHSLPMVHHGARVGSEWAAAGWPKYFMDEDGPQVYCGAAKPSFFEVAGSTSDSAMAGILEEFNMSVAAVRWASEERFRSGDPVDELEAAP